MCSGTASLSDDCSGWALLRHMLPLLPDVKKYSMTRDAACGCSIEIPLTVTVHEHTVSMWKAIFPSFPFTKARLELERSRAMMLACCGALASRNLQGRVNNSPPLLVHVYHSYASLTGMRAAIANDHYFVARIEERDAIAGAVKSVLDGTSHEARRVLLLVGQPGVGKSLLARQAISSAQALVARQNGFMESTQCVEIIRGRGSRIVDEDLLALGRNLGSLIGVNSASPPDIVLVALRRFFEYSRYILLIDDADEDGLVRVLQFLPVSKQCCALMITSSSTHLTRHYVAELLMQFGDNNSLYFHKELQTFTPEECLALMKQVWLRKCEAFFKREGDLLAVFEGLGRLPLAVRLFAEWSEMQFSVIMLPHVDDMKAKMQAALKIAQEVEYRARQPYDREQAEAQFRLDYDAATGRFTAAVNELLQRWRSEKDNVVLQADATHHSRGLLGTVRLALLQLDTLSPDVKEASKQLLGLLALCPADKVPWSLFDGVSHWSAAGQACRVSRDDGSGGTTLDDAVIAYVLFDAEKEILGESVVVQLQDGQEMLVAPSRVEFEPHIIDMVVKDNRYQVQLLTPQPDMRGARIELYGFKKNVANNGLQGRVVQRHEDGTVSVAFGCETGEYFSASK
jgi:hypothetical protein